MAKKASKKKEVAAPKKAVAGKKNPVGKAAKSAPATKPAAKPAKAAVAKAKPAKAAPPPAKAVKAAPAKPVKPVKPVKEVAVKGKVEKAEVKAPKSSKSEEKAGKLKLVTPEVEAEISVASEAKKEKKVKIDKTGLNEDQIKWHEMNEKYKGVKAPTYSISAQYEAKTPIMHKIFGWGYILTNEYDRLEVLFQDAKRMLISNRKL